MRGREFLAVATYLDGLESEASLRTRTSRLYYAAFLEARSSCERHLEYTRTRSGREHADVPRLLRAQDPELADNLVFLRTLRNSADYDMDLSPDTVVLQFGDARLLADSIIARLDELVPPGADS